MMIENFFHHTSQDNCPLALDDQKIQRQITDSALNHRRQEVALLCSQTWPRRKPQRGAMFVGSDPPSQQAPEERHVFMDCADQNSPVSPRPPS